MTLQRWRWTAQKKRGAHWPRPWPLRVRRGKYTDVIEVGTSFVLRDGLRRGAVPRAGFGVSILADKIMDCGRCAMACRPGRML